MLHLSFYKHCILLLIYLAFSSAILASTPNNFSKSKKIAAQIFLSHPITLYCGCRYQENQIDLSSCGMQSAAHIKRAHRLEWEHMMPAENFGHHLSCWQEKICVKKNGEKYKGRKCCEEQNETFRTMEAELYNLWPEVGLVNQARSNYRFSELPGHNPEENFYGCSFIIDKQLKQVEPRDGAKGIVARANLFMADKYGVTLSPSQQQLFQTWNQQYPPSQTEILWAKEVSAIEGYTNSFIHN